jgi:hypothetical protein
LKDYKGWFVADYKFQSTPTLWQMAESFQKWHYKRGWIQHHKQSKNDRFHSKLVYNLPNVFSYNFLLWLLRSRPSLLSVCCWEWFCSPGREWLQWLDALCRQSSSIRTLIVTMWLFDGKGNTPKILTPWLPVTSSSASSMLHSCE